MPDPALPPVTPDEPRIDLTLDGWGLTLLGTAHVSQASADKVAELIGGGGYDAVAVELCRSRYQALTNPDALAQLDLVAVIRKGRAYMVVANLALAAYQQRLADELGIEPGAEQRVAIELARSRNLPLLLIDREVGLTLRRLARGLGLWRRINLFSGLLAAMLSDDRVSPDDVEHLKQGDVLETAFAELATDRRDLYAPLIDERDRYMAARLRQELQQLPPGRVLVVIGAGHLRGVAAYLTGAAATEPGARSPNWSGSRRRAPGHGACPGSWLG